MRPLLRTAVTGMAVLAVVAGVATGVTQPASASPVLHADTVGRTATPIPGSTPAPAATSTSTPAPAPSTTAAPSTAPTAPQADPVAADPSLATMNAAGNHSMGSTVEQFEGTPAPKVSARMAAPLAATAAAGTPPGVPGLDVSGWQVLNAANWVTIRANGARFVYVKATEATDYTSSQFSEQYNDSYAAGLAHGAYHFATPNTSSGAAQANWFMAHGGAGTNDGRTMPPLLDIEYNPYGATCYGLSQARDGVVDPRLHQHDPRQDRSLGGDLFDDELVDDLHGQQQPVRGRTRSSSRATRTASRRAQARSRRAGAATPSGSTPTPVCSRATRTSSTAAARACPHTRSVPAWCAPSRTPRST